MKIVSKEANDYEDKVLREIAPSFDAPSNIRYFAGSAMTKDGLELPRVIFMRRQDARRSVCALEWLEQNDEQWMNEIEVDPSDIANVQSSSFRLPIEIVNSIIEHGIGSMWFILTLINGSEIGFYNWRGDIGQMDFLQLPEGENPRDVVSIRFERPPPMQVLPRAERLDYGIIRLCIYPSSDKGRTILSDGKEMQPTGSIRKIEGRTQRVINFKEKPSWTGMNLVKTLPYGFLMDIHGRPSLVKEMKRLGYLPATKLSEDVKRNLKSIPPLGPNWVEVPVKLENGTVLPQFRVTEEKDRSNIPVSLTLKDGTTLPRVIIIDEKVALENPYYWGRFVKAEDVTSVEPSSFTLPYDLRKCLPSETSMSSLEFRVKTINGSLYACWYSGFSPFIELPPPHQAKDIVDIQIGQQLAQYERAILVDPDFVWCICNDI